MIKSTRLVNVVLECSEPSYQSKQTQPTIEKYALLLPSASAQPQNNRTRNTVGTTSGILWGFVLVQIGDTIFTEWFNAGLHDSEEK